MEIEDVHRRARTRRANPLVYGFVRVTFQLFFHLYFRFERIGLRHVPRHGPVIIAANHRSFLDPFVIACMARRPMYYVAKQEIFLYNRVLSWLLAALGAFPVARGAGDAESIATAKAILARGDIVLIFPEGTRTRPGPLGRARRGVGRLALETGVPVVPMAVLGTEAVRRGWRIRPHKVRLRAGRPLRFPRVDEASATLAGAVTDRIWPCVMLQWEWLGGMPPARRAAVIGAGPRARTLAACLARAGLRVDLAGPAPDPAERAGAEPSEPAGADPSERPAGVRVVARADLDLTDVDAVCLAMPAAELPSALAAHGSQITREVGLLVACDGTVPRGTLPSAFAAEHTAARAVAVLGGPGAGTLAAGDTVVVACTDRGFARQLAEPLRDAGLEVSISRDVTGVEQARLPVSTRAA